MSSSYNWTEPNYQDEVKRRFADNDSVGVVIAKYSKDGKIVLDIRLSDDRVFYGTLASNWTTTRTREEIENGA